MIWPFSPPSPRSPLRWRPHRGLFQLEHWSGCWCLPLGPDGCGASFFSVDPHREGLLLLGSHLRFGPAPAFLRVAFDRTLSFSEHVPLLRAGFFPCLGPLRYVSDSSWNPSKKSLSLLCGAFLRPLLTCASPEWFPFLGVANITKLERFHRAASRAIIGCLSSSPIPLLLSEVSLPPLRVNMTHFTLSSYKWALRLPTSFHISGLARLGVKPRLCRSSWRAFASTHPLMLSSTSLREALLTCPPFPPWNLPSFIVESTLTSPCSRSNPPLSRSKVRFSPTLSLSPRDLVLWTDDYVPLPFGKGGSGVLANCSLCGTGATVSFSAGPVCSSFSAEACTILHALCWSRQHHKVCHFSSLII